MNNDILTWLQQWYLSNCDGEWERDWVSTIETLANPGWSVFLSIRETRMEGVEFHPVDIERSEHDWIYCKVEEGEFSGAGGPLNLTELLETFQTWVMLYDTQHGSASSS